MDISLRRTSAGTKKVSVLERVDYIWFITSLTGTSFLATRSNSRTSTHVVRNHIQVSFKLRKKEIKIDFVFAT